jgi:hypothetical protein
VLDFIQGIGAENKDNGGFYHHGRSTNFASNFQKFAKFIDITIHWKALSWYSRTSLGRYTSARRTPLY